MRTTLACHVSPLLIRIALAVTFLWAGASKVFFIDGFSGAPAAGLANAGISAAQSAARPVVPSPSVPAPANREVTPPPPPAPAPRPAPAEPEPSLPEPNGAASHDFPSAAVLPARWMSEDPAAASASSPSVSQAAPVNRQYTTEQFPQDAPVQLRRLYGLVLAMDGAHQRGQWPDFLASPAAYSGLAWAASLTELLAGTFLLFGFLTRLAGLGVVGVMGGALWMTQIGPSIASGDPFLGFLPQLKLDDAGAWIGAWKDMLWQFGLLMMGLAVFFSGPGKLAIDAILFGGEKRSSREDDDE